MKERDLTGLTLVDGFTAEEITKKLNKMQIRFREYRPKYRHYLIATSLDLKSRYARGKSREITEETKKRVREALNFPDNFRKDDYFYYAYYRINSDFDITRLDRKVTFHKGLIIESTQLMF
jgi:hypothetical protein